ncbi:uncharacterized protein LOC143031307 [Oratosquilla oratoria]|uniref:uncharacterized protein LOC143031307 n=1 Tax=Oratosquilla oratoria TaxID=337810 RepID=UPI003F77163A
MKMWHCALAVFCLVAVVSAGTFPHNHGGHVVGGNHPVVGGGHVGGHHGVDDYDYEYSVESEYSFAYEYGCCDHVRPGQCPPARSVCPLSDTFRPPNPCYNDDDCFGRRDKCCFDTCLGHKTCKPVQPSYG